MLDARYSHLYFCQSLNRLQRGLSAIAELLVTFIIIIVVVVVVVVIIIIIIIRWHVLDKARPSEQLDATCNDRAPASTS